MSAMFDQPGPQVEILGEVELFPISPSSVVDVAPEARASMSWPPYMLPVESKKVVRPIAGQRNLVQQFAFGSDEACAAGNQCDARVGFESGNFHTKPARQ